ncbi:MAG: HAD family hydrolase [Candidatus Micrarchaeia archaeon]
MAFHDIKAVVFDLDGTLVNTLPIIIDGWVKTFNKLGIHVNKEELSARIRTGIATNELIRAYVSNASDEQIISIRQLRLSIIKDRLSKNLLFPGVEELLQKLKSKGVKLAIATGMSSGPLEIVVKSSGLGKYISTIVSSDDVKRTKPAPDIVLEAFRRLGIDPKCGVVVGDTEKDVLAGKAAGAHTVLICNECDKKETVAEKVINSIGELSKILGLN